MSDIDLSDFEDEDSPDAPEANSPALDLSDFEDEDQTSQLLSEKYNSSSQSPDDFAKAKSLADKTGLPMITAMNQRDKAEKIANRPDWATFSKAAPVAARSLANDGTLFQMAHDDHQNLSAIEQGLVGLGKKPEATTGERIKDQAIQLAAGLSDVPKAIIGIADIARPIINIMNPASRIAWGLLENTAGDGKETYSSIVKKLGVDFGAAGAAAEDLMSPTSKYEAELVNNAFDQGLMDGGFALLENPAQIAESVTRSVPSMVTMAMGTRAVAKSIFDTALVTAEASGVTGQAALDVARAAVSESMPFLGKVSAGIEGAQSAGDVANDYAVDGEMTLKDFIASGGQGLTTALIGVLSNKIGGALGLEDVEASAAAAGLRDQVGGFFERIIKGAIKEGPFEEGLQSGAEAVWSNFGNDRELTAGVGRAMVEGTLTGTAMGGGMAAATSTADIAIEKLSQRRKQSANEANETQAKLIKSFNDVSGSLLGQRDKKSLQQLMDAVAEDEGNAAPTHMLVSADVFKQGGIDPEVFKTAAPSVADQVDQAIQLGGTLSVPVGELFTGFAGTGMEKTLTDHMKVSEDAWTAFETSQSDQQEALDQFAVEAEKIRAEQTDKQVWDSQAKVVYDGILSDLNQSETFDKKVNQAYATLVRDFYSVMAPKLGMTPDQLFEKDRLRVGSVRGDGAVFNQPEYTDEEKSFFNSMGIDTGNRKSNVNTGTGESGERDANGQSTGSGNHQDPRYVHGESDLLARLVRANEAIGADPRTAAGIVGAEWTQASSYSDLSLRRGSFVLDERSPEVIKTESDRLIASAKKNGFFVDNAAAADLFRKLSPFKLNSGIEHDAFRMEGDSGDVVLRVTAGGRYGSDETKSPAQYLHRIEEYNKTFPELQMRVLGVGQRKDGKAYILTAQTFVDGKEFDNMDQLHAAMVAQGWESMERDHEGKLTASRYRNKKTGAIIVDVHEGNVLHDDEGNLYPIDVHIEKLPKGLLYQNNDGNRAEFNPTNLNINLLETADLSSFLHETGHFFLEMYSRYADQSAEVAQDMEYLLSWFGIAGENGTERRMNWNSMTLDQQRIYHEKFAESFEQYLFEGKAPSIELQSLFDTFGRWLTSVYKSIAKFLASHNGAKLTPEVRGVMDRMIATQEQILEVAEVRASKAMFTTQEQSGMTDAQWKAYQEDQKRSIEQPITELTGRSLRDMQYLSNAKGKALKKLQREAEGLRRLARMDARRDVLTRAEYRAWLFLKRKTEGKPIKREKSKQVDPDVDSLFVAIAKLGGLDRSELSARYGYGANDFKGWSSGVFGKPVVRKDGGMALDEMARDLVAYGYMQEDENGRTDTDELDEMLFREVSGDKVYSMWADYDYLLHGDRTQAPDQDSVDYVGGRLDRAALMEMYGTNNPDVKWEKPVAYPLAGYDNKAQVEEKKGTYNENQISLFDEAGNAPHAKPGKKTKKPSGNVEPASRIPGRFATTVGSETVRQINAGFEKLDTPEKVAFATSHITKNPQEVLLVLVTDKDHKPISILRHAVGMKDSSSVDVGIVSGWAVNVPGGAHIWISHNHPSGKPTLSQADVTVSSRVDDLLLGTHLQSHGIMAVTHEGRFGWNGDYRTIDDGAIPDAEKSVQVDVVERELKTTGRLSSDYEGGITGFQDAVKAVTDIGGGESGLMLLDAQYRPIGFVSVDFAKSLKIRGEKLQSDILGAIELSNAVAAISYSADNSADAEKGLLNVGGLIEMALVRPVDVLMDHGSHIKSWATNGARLAASTFQQPGDKKDDASKTRSLESMGMVSNEGLHPDVVADLFGLSSGDELVRKLLTIDDPMTAINKRTDDLMMQRHSEFTDPKTMERMAEAAIHNEARVRFVATELAMLNKAMGGVNVILKAAKMYAAEIISGQKIADIRPAKHAADAARAGREAYRMLAKGKTADVVMAKRNQVLHTEAARQSYEAQAEVDKGLGYFKRLEKAINNGRLDPDYGQQIIGLLERYDLRKSVSLLDLERRDSLSAWVQKQQDQGFEPVIPDYLLQDAAKTHYKRMTVDEFRDLIDAVKNIEHLGRLKHSLVQKLRQRQLAAAATEIGAAIEDNAKNTIKDKLEKNSIKDRAADLFNGFLYMHRKFSNLLREMDGWKDGGVLWDYFGRTMNDAGDAESKLREDATIAIDTLMQPLLKSGGFGLLPSKKFIPEINDSLSREGRIMVALNWGNDGNRQRLLDGDGWSPEQVGAILKTLNRQDWEFVQGTWDFLNTYRDQVGAQQKRLTGVEPKWIEPAPFELMTADGHRMQLAGGYFPAKYDADRSTKSLTQEALNTIMDLHKSVRAKTRDSYTKGRAAQVKDRPLRKDFGVIFGHITEVSHRLAWQDWLTDSKRLMVQPDVDNALRAHYGPQMIKELQSALDDIAAGEVGPQNEFESAINHLRTGATVAGLGYNLMTSLMQPLGLTQSMARIGSKWVAKGMAKWQRMDDALPWIYERSDMMRLRGKTMQREINEVMNQVRSPKRAKLNESFFFLIQKGQMIADIPTWLGAFEKAAAEGNDDSRAAALADQAVLDAQSGGMLKDLARVQRGSSFQKLFTMFMSYFNATYNLSVEAVKRTDFKDTGSVMALGIDYLLLYTLPAAIVTVMKAALTGGDDDELANQLVTDQITYMMGTLVGLREFSSVVSGFNGYTGPAGTRFFSEAGKLAKQIEQGEADAAFWKALNNTGGILLHYPSGQINKTLSGAGALLNDETDNPMALLFGSQK